MAQKAAVAEPAVGNAISAADEGVPGVGPIRREDWFQQLWRDRRAKFAEQKAAQQQALVFFGDSITQGWGDDFGGRFPGVKVANRGISGDTSRGLLARVDTDVLALNPRGIVLLIGTNDVQLNVSPEDIADNVKLLLAKIGDGGDRRQHEHRPGRQGHGAARWQTWNSGQPLVITFSRDDSRSFMPLLK